MDKLQAWMERIQLPPRQHVANLDHWELLAELRIDPGAMLMQRAGEDETERPHRLSRLKGVPQGRHP